MTLIASMSAAIVTAMRAGVTEFNNELAGSGSTLHVEAGVRRKNYGGATAGGRAQALEDDVEVIQAFKNSRQVRIGFMLKVEVSDAGGRQNSSRAIKEGILEAFGDDGVSFFRTHLTDTGSNLRNKSGRLELGSQIMRLESEDGGEDSGRLMVEQAIDIYCTVKGTLG